MNGFKGKKNKDNKGQKLETTSPGIAWAHSAAPLASPSSRGEGRRHRGTVCGGDRRAEDNYTPWGRKERNNPVTSARPGSTADTEGPLPNYEPRPPPPAPPGRSAPRTAPEPRSAPRTAPSTHPRSAQRTARGGGGSAPRTAPGAPLGFLRPSDERGFPCSGGSERKNSAVHLLTPAKTCQLPACISTYGRRDFPGKLRGVGSAIQDGLKERYNHPAHAPRM